MTSPQSPPPPGGQHIDVGAYILGVLDPAERLAFEEHLDGCARCAAEIDRLGGLEPLLAEFAAAAPPSGDPVPRPGEDLLDRLVGEVAATRRRTRTRRLVLAIAASVLIIGGPAVTAAVTATTASAPQQQTVAQQFSATDPTSGTSATVGVTPADWGSRISLDLAVPNLPGPLNCDLVAVSRHGDRQTVTTWSIPEHGYATATLHTVGGAGLSPTDIDHFEVRTLDTARLLVSVPATS